jgi:predicted nucleotide-binding protein (sugar kinase/HSP70/actin superfamily)
VKLTFPYMGNLFIPVKALLDELNLDYVLPVANTKYTLELGTRAAPEGACLPLKLCVGTLMLACRQGADTVLILSGLGPCRFGYYCQMQLEILSEAGYEMRAVHLLNPKGHFAQFFKQLSMFKGTCSWPTFLYHVRRAARIAYRVDHLERMFLSLQPREMHSGQTAACYIAFQQEARNTKGIRSMQHLVDKTFDSMAEIELDKRAQPLRVGIVGEIYDVIDQFSSLYLQEKLGRMGVEVIRPVTISSWIDHIAVLPMYTNSQNRSFKAAARPYLKIAIGGHAQETLGHAVLMAHEGVDGVIQIYPMGCMPEIVTQCIFPSLSIKEDIPVLSLVLDEMTAEVGLMTRVEAFLDLLYARRESNHRTYEGHHFSWGIK